MPLILAIAAWAAFWPTRRRTTGRLWALVLLVTLYLVAVVWETPGDSSPRYAALRPGLRLALAPGLDRKPLRGGGRGRRRWAARAPGHHGNRSRQGPDRLPRWNLLNASALEFEWDQSYGPLDWPQRGSRMLNIASDVALLEGGEPRQLRRDLLGALRATGERAGPRPAVRLPSEGEATEADRGIRRSGQLRGPGSEQPGRRRRRDGAGTGRHLGDADAGRRLGDEGFPQAGDTYTALIYDPKPSDAEMAAAGTAYPAAARPYVSFSLAGAPGGSRTLQVPFWASSGPAPIDGQVRGTPYEAMYGIARGLAEGAATPYEAARRIEVHLRTNYAYEQGCPGPGLPSPDFLALDRAGYCQQFSGAMALMLRMLGIPSRVASGFAPGVTNTAAASRSRTPTRTTGSRSSSRGSDG